MSPRPDNAGPRTARLDRERQRPHDLPAMAPGGRTGRVVRKTEKGYAFIQDGVSGVDLFFHTSDYLASDDRPLFEQLAADPIHGQTVAYQAEQTAKGWRARSVCCTDE